MNTARHWKHVFAFGLACALALLSSNIASAQGQSKAVAPAFAQKLTQLERQLRDVELRFATAAKRIESSSKIAVADMEAPELEKALDDYANALKSAFDEALADADRAAKSNGREGNAGNLPAFERVAKVHERRMAALRTRGDNIDKNIISGRVVIDRSLIEQYTTVERQELGEVLTPAARKRYPVELVPGKRSALEQTPFAFLAASTIGTAIDDVNIRACADWVANSIVGRAEALGAGICIGVCSVGAWTSCSACVAWGYVLTVQMWNTLRTCWSGVNKPRRTPLWLWRTGCVALWAAITG